jgi:hypothetical protein
MGKFENGILGGFTGKVGPVIGTTWRGINVMKSVPNIFKKHKFSERQLEQQARFRLIVGFLAPMRPFLEVGFKASAIRMTGYNSALAYNIKNAVSGVHPNLSIAYGLAATSRGELPKALNATATPGTAGKVVASWKDNSGIGKAQGTDQLLLVVHCPAAEDSAYSTGAACRADGTCTIDLPTVYSGNSVHVYLSFISVDGKDVSDSVYSGPVAVM